MKTEIKLIPTCLWLKTVCLFSKWHWIGFFLTNCSSPAFVSRSPFSWFSFYLNRKEKKCVLISARHRAWCKQLAWESHAQESRDPRLCDLIKLTDFPKEAPFLMYLCIVTGYHFALDIFFTLRKLSVAPRTNNSNSNKHLESIINPEQVSAPLHSQTISTVDSKVFHSGFLWVRWVQHPCIVILNLEKEKERR